MARFKLTIEYEGTRYSGWQVQKNARTVAGEICGALGVVLGSTQFQLQGAGRTDAGVHALGQVAHLEAATVLAPEILRSKLNDRLPADINIIEVEKTHPRFHARHEAVARRYLYQIATRRTAFGKRYVWWVKDPLAIERMAEAARHFEGMHDFRSFTDAEPEDRSTHVLIEEIVLRPTDDLILIRVTGSHFLWKQVRRIVGILAEVGRGALTPGAVRDLLRSESTLPAKLTAPPSGLFLERVYYDDDPRDTRLEPLLLITSPAR